jgi:hypothetical protein
MPAKGTGIVFMQNSMGPNIHSDHKSMAAFGPGDAGRFE